MVQCSSGAHCLQGNWFHIGCVGLNQESLPSSCEDWWYSEDCEALGRSITCNCKIFREVGVIECHAGKRCKRHRFYHETCVTVPTEECKCWQKCKFLVM